MVPTLDPTQTQTLLGFRVQQANPRGYSFLCAQRREDEERRGAGAEPGSARRAKRRRARDRRAPEPRGARGRRAATQNFSCSKRKVFSSGLDQLSRSDKSQIPIRGCFRPLGTSRGRLRLLDRVESEREPLAFFRARARFRSGVAFARSTASKANENRCPLRSANPDGFAPQGAPGAEISIPPFGRLIPRKRSGPRLKTASRRSGHPERGSVLLARSCRERARTDGPGARQIPLRGRFRPFASKANENRRPLRSANLTVLSTKKLSKRFWAKSGPRPAPLDSSYGGRFQSDPTQRYYQRPLLANNGPVTVLSKASSNGRFLKAKAAEWQSHFWQKAAQWPLYHLPRLEPRIADSI